MTRVILIGDKITFDDGPTISFNITDKPVKTPKCQQQPSLNPTQLKLVMNFMEQGEQSPLNSNYFLGSSRQLFFTGWIVHKIEILKNYCSSTTLNNTNP
jgi:hypothetical protein